MTQPPRYRPSHARRAAPAAALALVVLAAGACTDNCRKLSEKVCSFYRDGYFGANEEKQCLANVKQYYNSYPGSVRWEDEYRCGRYLDSCTREAIEQGQAQECGLTVAGPFSPCASAWHRACDCAMGGTSDRLAACHAAADQGQFAFSADMDQQCGALRDRCTCDALSAGDCAACGFPQCGAFSPCSGNWLAACECTVGDLPDKLVECRAKTGSAAANPFAPVSSPAQFSTAEEARCGAAAGGCTCAALKAGDCARCGFSAENCIGFDPCHVLGYHLCACSVTGDAAAAACRSVIDVLQFDAAANGTCAHSAGTCTCDTLVDAASCPGAISWLYSPCRALSYQLCGCPAIAGDRRSVCAWDLVSPGFTPDDEAACAAMKGTCTCDALDAGTGCPGLFSARLPR